MKETGPGARERMKSKRKQDKQTEFKTNKQKKYVHRSIIYTYTIFTRYLHSDINTAYAHTHTELGHPVPQPLSPRASALRRFGRTNTTSPEKASKDSAGRARSPALDAPPPYSCFHCHTALRKSSRVSSCLLTPCSFHRCFSTTAWSGVKGRRKAGQGASDKDCAVDREREPGQKTHLGSNSCVI